jgi:Bacterial EndoU nuclease
LAIKVSAARRIHILDGDATGGGHGPGRGVPGKSEFPAILTDDQIIAGIENIANDPVNYPRGVIPTVPGRLKIVGQINGVATVVIVDPLAGDVITAWPLGIPINP